MMRNMPISILTLLLLFSIFLRESRGEVPDISGWSPLMKAIEEGDLIQVEKLLASGSEVNYATPLYGVTPLVVSVYHRNQDITRLLLDAGANPNARTKRGYAEYEDSPLLLAVKGGCPEIVSLLVSAGVNVNSRYYRGRTALLYSLSYGRPKVVKILLEAGADIDVRDDEGLGLREWAAISGAQADEMIEVVNSTTNN